MGKRQYTDEDLLDEIQQVLIEAEDFNIAQRVDRILETASPSVYPPIDTVFELVDIPLLDDLELTYPPIGCGCPEGWVYGCNWEGGSKIELPGLLSTLDLVGWYGSNALVTQRKRYSFEAVEAAWEARNATWSSINVL